MMPSIGSSNSRRWRASDQAPRNLDPPSATPTTSEKTAIAIGQGPGLAAERHDRRIEPRGGGRAPHLGEPRRDHREPAEREGRHDEPDRLGARAVEAPDEREPGERQGEGQERARRREPPVRRQPRGAGAVHRGKHGRARAGPSRAPPARTRSRRRRSVTIERRRERLVDRHGRQGRAAASAGSPWRSGSRRVRPRGDRALPEETSAQARGRAARCPRTRSGARRAGGA